MNYKAPKHIVAMKPAGLRPRSQRQPILLMQSPHLPEWMSIVNYLKGETGIRKSVCVNCFSATLYDKENNPISIRASTHSFEQVKKIVADIKNK